MFKKFLGVGSQGYFFRALEKKRRKGFWFFIDESIVCIFRILMMKFPIWSGRLFESALSRRELWSGLLSHLQATMENSRAPILMYSSRPTEPSLQQAKFCHSCSTGTVNFSYPHCSLTYLSSKQHAIFHTIISGMSSLRRESWTSPTLCWSSIESKSWEI